MEPEEQLVLLRNEMDKRFANASEMFKIVEKRILDIEGKMAYSEKTLNILSDAIRMPVIESKITQINGLVESKMAQIKSVSKQIDSMREISQMIADSLIRVDDANEQFEELKAEVELLRVNIEDPQKKEREEEIKFMKENFIPRAKK
jgi:uncharacterized coiled-coil protein SlyX